MPDPITLSLAVAFGCFVGATALLALKLGGKIRVGWPPLVLCCLVLVAVAAGTWYAAAQMIASV
jgi:hypothetical protein